MVGIRFSPYELASRDRKERKPIIEKMRRERMNTSISQLRDLISDTIKRNAAPMSKVDKTDILGYTVMHLQELQRSTSCSSRDTVANSYDAGFKDCAREAVTFLGTNRLADESSVTDVSNHLYTVYMAKKKQGSGCKASRTSGPCLSTPVRRQNKALDSLLSSQIAPECSPIQRYYKTTSPSDMTSFRLPEIIDTSLGDLSFNTVMSVLNSTDSSSCDVSMRSKESSSADSDDSLGNPPSGEPPFCLSSGSLNMSLGTFAAGFLNEMNASGTGDGMTGNITPEMGCNSQNKITTRTERRRKNTLYVDEYTHGESQTRYRIPESRKASVWRPW